MAEPSRKSSGRRVIVFYVGYSNPFNGENYQSKVIYGSENAVVHIAEELAKDPKNQVFVFCNCVPDEELVFNEVSYLHLNKFHAFHNQVYINVMVVSRYLHFWYAFKIKADHTILWVHDAQFHDHFNGTNFPENGRPLGYNLVTMNKVDSIVCVTDWQKKYLTKWSGIPIEQQYKLKTIGNSIDKSYFDHTIPKIKNRFVWCSDTTRGLDILLNHWPDIIKEMPDATLEIFFGLVTEQQQKLIDSYGPGVNFRGKIPQRDLCIELCKADFWYYPSTSHETFCIVAMQAMYAKCVCVCRDYSGVAEVVGNYGLLVPGFPTDPNFKKTALDFIFNVAKKPDYKKQIQENGMKGATTWAEKAEEWKRLIDYQFK
jgi:glycosyltransferase involved in cell wall biosynthesis